MKETAQRMYNRALFYLQRFAATEKHLTFVLNRQLQNKARKGIDIPPQAKQWVTETVTKCVALGLVNDRYFAESRINSLRRAGRSTSYIKQHLQAKGVDKNLAASLLAGDDHVDDEAMAVRRFIEKKRLGHDTTPEARQKDLGKLLRAGFAYGLARDALQEKLNEQREA